MLLKEKDGILCDICGSTHRITFTYYSMEGSKIIVDTSRHITNRLNKDVDVDICTDCYTKIVDKCRNNLGNQPSHGIKCDISGKVYTGQFEYYIMIADKIEVDGSKCLEAKEIVQPDLEIDRKIMDFKMGQEYVNSLVNTMLETRKRYTVEAQ